MVFILINNGLLVPNSPVPNECRDFINPVVWNEICHAYASSSSSGHAWACLCETCFCFLIGFPCIFCCHPVISSSLIENSLKERLTTINASFYSGSPVLTVSIGIGIQVNTDFIPGQGPIAPVQIHISQLHEVKTQQNDVPIAHAEYYSNSPSSYSGSGVVQPVTIVQGSTAVREVLVTIPHGASPGTVLTASTPENILVNVTVPPDGFPGKVLRVQY